MKNITYIFSKNIYGSLLMTLLASSSIQAQNPAPARAQVRPITLMGATIHVGNGQVISNGAISFDNGIITAVGATADVKLAGTEVIEVKGMHIFPGIISLNTTVGLQEVASVRATLDFSEVGEINPHIRSLVAYDTDSEVIPTLRANGIVVSQAVPQGGIISGTSSAFYTDGWNWEDAVLKKDDGVWINWPPFLANTFNAEDFSFSIKRNEKRQAVIDELRQTFRDARAYAETENPKTVNVRMEAMKGILNGTGNLYIRAGYAKDIIESIGLAKEFGIKKVVIVGGNEAFKVTGFLKDNKIPVILNPTHRLPGSPDENVYLPYELPGILHKAGVKVAIAYADEWWRTRNLAFMAGTSSGFSEVTPEEALQFVTKNAAEILGADRLVGTLEKGKHASLIVSEGDILDMRGNNVKMIYIKGGKVNLDDKQKRLYQKYKEKYQAK
ncbi:amidohydrolase family protein [Dyadobacter helix]|nr:amidohydrolase family protein [Dyadobacter sp. CECT 9275]